MILHSKSTLPRDSIGRLGLFLTSCFLFSSFVGWAMADCSEARSGKPNIIYILADDLGYGDLSVHGQRKFQTPSIDRLAAEGMLFTQHYAGSPVCAPSRATLMTGRHTGHTEVRGNRGMPPEGQYPLRDSTVTLPEILKKAGYVSGAFGKWGLGGPGSEGDPIHQGFDEFFGYNCQTLAHSYYPRHLWHNKEKIVLTENEGEKRGIYAPVLIHEKTLEFIEKNKDTPFFLYVPSIIPHAELVAPEEYLAKFRGRLGSETPYRGVDSLDQDGFRVRAYSSQAHPHAAYAAMITLLDDQVGEIVRKVTDLGLEKNTLIIFTSDNGPAGEGGSDPDFFGSSGPFRGYKRDLYEGGIRVPMIAWWPGTILSGSKTDQISAFWDVMPTLAELAQTENPVHIDGISFLPTLLGKNSQQKHEYLYWEFHEQGRKQAVRLGNWKAVRTGIASNPRAPIELYDISVDIGEERNIAGQHPELVKKMEEIMRQAHEEDPAWPFFSPFFPRFPGDRHSRPAKGASLY